MIVIIDYDMGNVGSIANMIKHVGGTSIISNDTNVIEGATKLILPGVGAFDTGMRNIKHLGLHEVLDKKVLTEKTPILGICLGMQLLGKQSEEGTLPGLGWIDATTVRLPSSTPNVPKLRIPHMGWNFTSPVKSDPLLEGFEASSRFYFVHSYHMVCNHPEDILTTTSYGISFTSAVSRGNIYGTQFHPEKSHSFGMRLFRNFVHGT